MGPAQTNLHKVLANNELSGEVLLRLLQAQEGSIPRADMAEHKRFGLALLCHSPNILDGCVSRDGMVVERPSGITLLYSLEGRRNPGVVNDLVDKNIGALGKFLKVPLGVRSCVA